MLDRNLFQFLVRLVRYAKFVLNDSSVIVKNMNCRKIFDTNEKVHRSMYMAKGGLCVLVSKVQLKRGHVLYHKKHSCSRRINCVRLIQKWFHIRQILGLAKRSYIDLWTRCVVLWSVGFPIDRRLPLFFIYHTSWRSCAIIKPGMFPLRGWLMKARPMCVVWDRGEPLWTFASLRDVPVGGGW